MDNYNNINFDNCVIHYDVLKGLFNMVASQKAKHNFGNNLLNFSLSKRQSSKKNLIGSQ